jgi:5-methylcytosine-specific restriction endonuclease McrA
MSDPINSWRWTQVSREVRKRDLYRCQWRLEGCTEYADTTDHIIPRAGWGGPMFDRSNLVASCGHCNRKRPHIRHGEYGSYGTRPRSFFSEQRNARGGLAEIPLRSRWPVIRGGFSRKAGAE